MARGGRRKAEREENHTGPLLLALVAVVAIAVTGAALLFGPAADAPVADDPGPTPSPGPSTAGLDLSNLPMTRTLSCDAIEDVALATALGGPAGSRESYGSGDRVEITPGVTDTAHENLCGFAAAGARARVWVFAAPVRAPQARRLVRDVRATPGCTFPAVAAGFGTPGLTSLCTHGDDEVVTLRGLFGDAWLSCELSVSGEADPDAVRTRADRWCVHVATTLGARP